MNNREEILLDLFIHPGWKMVMEEMEEARHLMVSTTHNLNTERELWKRKGVIEQLSNLLSYEDVFRAELDEAERETELAGAWE